MNTAKKYYDDPEFYEALRDNGLLETETPVDVPSENIIINDSLDVDVNLDALKLEGITEEEIDEYFDVDAASIDSSNNKLDSNSEKNAKKKMKQANSSNL